MMGEAVAGGAVCGEVRGVARPVSPVITIDGITLDINDALLVLNAMRGKRVSQVHRRSGYYNVDGQKYVSVTEALGVLAKPALITWAAKTAAGLVLEDPVTYSTPEQAAAGIYRKRDQAGARGTTVHSLIEAHMEGAALNIEELPPKLRGYGRAFEKWCAAHRPSLMVSELMVVNDEYRYAGRSDLVCELLDGAVWLIDFKTSAGFYDEHKLQVTAYRHAQRVRPKYEKTLSPMPHIDRAGVVLLGSDGTYAMKEMDAPIERFHECLNLWRWMNEAQEVKAA